MTSSGAGYYRSDLARVHHEGFGFHADACAPPLLRLLEPVLERDGLVLELGCGSGLLTRHLLDSGLRVVATDASTAMLDLAAEYATGADLRHVVLPDEPLPQADAVVGVGHVLNYLPDAEALERGLAAAARALRPGGILALDLCDLEWGRRRRDQPPHVQVHDDWVITTRFSMPDEHTYLRDITTFLRRDDDSWTRDDEHHHNVLVDVAHVVERVADATGIELVDRIDLDGEGEHLAGLRFVVGRRAEE